MCEINRDFPAAACNFGPRRIPVVLVALIAWAISGASVGSSASTQNRSEPAATSVWDGVFSEEQARRGAELYGEKCSSCHLDNLMGYEYAPPLTVEYFLGDWGMGAQTLADLFESIRRTMPKESPGSLSARAYADILAYILQANHLPNGPAALASDAAVLAHIRITARPPQ